MTEVRCTVHSCEFWEKGDYCSASKIWVRNNFAGGDDEDLIFNGDFEFAEEMGPHREEYGEIEEVPAALSSHQTCCETMRLKGEEGGPGKRRDCR